MVSYGYTLKNGYECIRNAADNTGYIYFIQMDLIGPIKIGFSNNFKNRLVGLQTANPYPLNLLIAFPGNDQMENHLHEKFRVYHIRGEWFHPDEDIIREISAQKEINDRAGFSINDCLEGKPVDPKTRYYKAN